MTSFGDFTAANYPLPHMGRGRGQTTNIEDQVRLLTIWARAQQAITLGAFGGPSFLESNIGLMATNDSTPWLQLAGKVPGVESLVRGGLEAAESRIGTRNRPAPGEHIASQQGTLEVVDVSDASAPGSSISKVGKGVLSVLSMRAGAVENTQPLLYLDNHVCGMGPPATQYLIGSNTPFGVKPDGTVCAAKAGITEVRVDKLRIQEGSYCTGRPEKNCAVELEATTGGLSVIGYGLDDGEAVDGATWSFAKDGSGLNFHTGTAATFESPDGTQTGSIVMSDTGALGLGIGADKVTIPGFLDPTGLGLTPQASQPSQLDASTQGLWVDTSNNLWYWDGLTNSLVAPGGGGGSGAHQVTDANNATSIEVVSITHDLSSGAGSAGMGAHMGWYLEDGSNNVDEVSRIAAVYTNSTDGAENVDLLFQTMIDGTLTTVLNLDASNECGVFDRYSSAAGGVATTLHLRALDDANGTPSDGFGGRIGLNLQRAADTITFEGAINYFYTSVASRDMDVSISVVDGGTSVTPFLLDGSERQVVAQWSDAGTNDVQAPSDLRRTTSGTPSSGFGVRATATLENDSAANVTASRQDVVWTSPTGSSEEAYWLLGLIESGTMRDRIRVDPQDGGPLITYYSYATSDDLQTSHTTRVERLSANGGTGLGSRWAWSLEDSAGAFPEVAYLDVLWTSPTSGAGDADMVLSALANNSIVEALRIDADGDGVGGTATAVRVTQGRFDLMEQATPGTPVTNAHRVYVDKETAWRKDETALRSALDNVDWCSYEATQQSSGGAAAETLMTHDLTAGLLATDDQDAVRITVWGRVNSTGGAGSKQVDLQFGGTTIASYDTGSVTVAKVWRMVAIVSRVDGTNQRSITMVRGGSHATAPDTDWEEIDTPGETLSGAVTIRIRATDSTSGNSVIQDGMLIEPLIRG